jgi:O-antigen/teichoic acid export membrane protein
MTLGMKFLAFFLTVRVARDLQAEGLGLYSFLLSYVLLVVAFGDLGISSLVIREYARDRSLITKSFYDVLGIKCFLFILVYIFSFPLIGVLGKASPTLYLGLLFFLSAFAIFSFGDYIRCIFDSQQKMHYQAVIELIRQSLVVGICLLFLGLGYGVVSLGVGYLIANSITALIWVVCFRIKFGMVPYKIDFSTWKPWIKRGTPFFLMALFGIIQYHIDTILLNVFSPFHEQSVGYFRAAFNIIMVLVTVGAVLTKSFLPVFSTLYAQGDPKLSKVFSQALKYFFMAGLPLSVGGMLVADKIILFIYGDAYLSSVQPFLYLSMTVLLVFCYGLANTLLLAMNKEYFSLVVFIIGSFVNIVLNILLIPRFDVLGSCWATLAAKLFILVMLGIWCYKMLGGFSFTTVALKTSAATFVMALVVILLKGHIHLLILLCVAVILYAAIALLIGLVGREETDLIKKVFRPVG